ncbi:Mediator of RNA polymerase II transcription subunit 22a, partial [Linum perenne]
LLRKQVQAADSLLKLVSDLKQTAIFSGFASLTDHVDQRIAEFNQLAEKSDNMLARIAEEAAASLKELETHYYSSSQRTNQNPRT